MGEQQRAGRGSSQRRSRERREQLLRAALTLLERGGAKAVTHRAVSEEAGLPSATAAYYFPAVGDLTMAAIAFHVQQRLEILDTVSAATQRREPQTPLALAHDMAERVANGRTHVTICDYEVFLEAARNPSFRPIASAGRQEVERFFSTDVAQTGARNAAQTTRAYVALIEGFGLRELAFGSDGVDVDTAADAFVALLAYARATDPQRERIRDSLRGPLLPVPEPPNRRWPQPAPTAGEAPTRGASQRRSRDRREQLLAAAAELFEAGGSKAITHRAVSQAAGLPPATAGYYFPLIEELVTGAVEFHVRRRIDAIAMMLGKTRQLAASPLDLIEVTHQAIAAASSGLRATHFSLFLEAARNPEFRPIAAAARRDFEALASRFFAQLGARDAHRGAQAYLAITEGLALQRLASGGGDEEDVALATDAMIALVHFFSSSAAERDAIAESLRTPPPAADAGRT